MPSSPSTPRTQSPSSSYQRSMPPPTVAKQEQLYYHHPQPSTSPMTAHLSRAMFSSSSTSSTDTIATQPSHSFSTLTLPND
ncbi:hypothetical protein HDU76_012045, partial [Blyttiomyces sp. JEL0837]